MRNSTIWLTAKDPLANRTKALPIEIINIPPIIHKMAMNDWGNPVFCIVFLSFLLYPTGETVACCQTWFFNPSAVYNPALGINKEHYDESYLL
jgi:hypothetical protein